MTKFLLLLNQQCINYRYKLTLFCRRGEIDFNESLRQRVGLLAGTPASVIEIVRGRIQFTPGAHELCRALKRLGYKLAVLSGMWVLSDGNCNL